MENFGKILVVLGVLAVIVGLSFWFFGDKFGWLGNLPGDIRIERPGFRFYMPLTSMIIISVVLSVVVSLIGRLLK